MPASRLTRFNLALTLTLATTSASAASGPAQALQDFLDWHREVSPSGYPRAAEELRLRTLVSRELLCLLRATARYSEKYQKKFPEDKPPYIEGDLFLSSVFERPERANIESLRPQASTATALVQFSIDSASFAWRDRFHLRLENGHWRVADIDRLGPGMNRQGQFSFGGQSGSLLNALYAELDRNEPQIRWTRRDIAACKPMH